MTGICYQWHPCWSQMSPTKGLPMLKAAILDRLSTGWLSASMDKGKDDDYKMKHVVEYGLI